VNSTPKAVIGAPLWIDRERGRLLGVKGTETAIDASAPS
jgi:hypothetical protein